MNAIETVDFVSVADYLAGELRSHAKSEYVGGVVYAMSGARVRHNRIATSILAALASRLRGRRCEAFNSDMKVRIQSATQVRFYYPDAMVVCQSNSDEDSYQDAPTVIVEVLSAKTRRIDLGEKCEAYLNIPSLRLYLIVEQAEASVVAYRRTHHGFVREVFRDLEAVIPIPEIETDLPMTEIYQRVQFGLDSEDEDDPPT